MPQVDGLLRIVTNVGGGLLKLCADEAPQVLLGERALDVFLPATPEDTLVALLGDLLSPDRQETLAEGKPVAFGYETRALGRFEVQLSRGGDGRLRADFSRALLSSAVEAPEHQHGSEQEFGSAQAGDSVVSASPQRPGVACEFADVQPAAPVRVAPAGPAAPQAAAMPPVVPPHGDALVTLTHLFEAVVQLGASDLHLGDGEPAVVRVDGALRPIDGEPRETAMAYLRLLQSASGVRERLAVGQSVDYALEVPRLGRFRVNVYRHEAGSAAAIRVLRRQAPTLASLGLPARLDDLLALPHGLVLVTGPTGSGKSTTLAALARAWLRRRGGLLVTLEDPIEYAIIADSPGALVRQREVGRHAGTFASGLRDALREDPDILLIGEMRDPETISLALTAAETGHLVLASLHSRSAGSAVERIVDTYAPERQRQIRVQLADALRCVVAQRLVPRSAGQGRTVAIELMRVNHNVASLIRDGKTAQIPTALQAGQAEGMLPLEKCLAQLVASHVIDIDAARAVANDPSALGHYLRHEGL